MFRNCTQLSGQLLRAVSSHDQSLVKINHEITKRWAGHSKWSNIKHVKMLKDQSKSTTFHRISKRIVWAVKENGEDPKMNHKLRTLLEEAKRVSMPNSTIQSAIKTAKLKKSAKPCWVTYRGLGGIIVSFEVMTPSIPNALTFLGQYTKKINLRFVKNPEEICTEVGVIISEPLKDVENGYDKALEDAIEFGIEEVLEDEDNTLIFKCLPNKLDIAHQKLVDKGYNVQSATVEIEFENYVNLSKEDMETFNNLIEKLRNSYEDVVRVSSNINETVS